MAYIESPIDRIVNVHFGGIVVKSFAINWTQFSGPPVADSATSMSVTSATLPTLGTLSLTAPPILIGTAVEADIRGSFPDGPDAHMNVQYHMRQAPVSYELQGFAHYDTVADPPFLGAHEIGIAVSVTLCPLLFAGSYTWSAQANLQLGDTILNEPRSGTAPSGGTLTFNAIATLTDPPSLIFT